MKLLPPCFPSLTEVSGSTPSTAMSSTRPRHTKSMSSSGHPSKSTLPPIDDNTELKARWAAGPRRRRLLPQWLLGDHDFLCRSQWCWWLNLIFYSIMYVHVPAPLLVVPPPLHLHTVLAPQRRTASLAVQQVAAPFTELNSETGVALPTTAPRLRPHYPTTQGLWLSNAGAPPLGSSGRSPQSLSAGQWRQKVRTISVAKLFINACNELCQESCCSSRTSPPPRFEVI